MRQRRASFKALAQQNNIPIVGVSETMLLGLRVGHRHGPVRDRIRYCDGDAAVLATAGGCAVIRQGAVDLAVPEPRATRVRIPLTPATLGGYVMLALLGLIYLIPLLFVLSVSLMSTRPCITSLDRRMVAIDLAEFRRVPLVIGVASGTHKASAILGAVRGGYIELLVTDDAAAKELLALARVTDDTEGGPRVLTSQFVSLA